MIDPFAGFDYSEDLLERSDILREWCREDHDFEYAVKYFTMCSDALKQLRDHLNGFRDEPAAGPNEWVHRLAQS